MKTRKPLIRFLSVVLSLVLVIGACTAFSACKEEKFTITYQLNEGTNNSGNPTTYTKKDLPLTISRPSREGYTFMGWTSEINTEKKASLVIELGKQQNLNLVAHWEKDGEPGTINYILDGGTNNASNKTTFTESEVGLTISGEPTRKGYVFIGWLVGDSNEKQMTVTISEYRYYVLTAQWSIGPEGYGNDKKLAPDFTLKNLKGEEVSLSDYRGIKPVVISLFHYTCENCKAQIEDVFMPFLRGEESLTTDDVEILLVHSAYETINNEGGTAKLLEVLDGKRAEGKSYDDFNIILDPDYMYMSEAGCGYYTGGVPDNYVVDKWGYLYKDKTLATSSIGFFSYGRMTDYAKFSKAVNGAIIQGEV